MKRLNIGDVTVYVERNIGSFHSARLKSLARLQLRRVLQRKNPYLFRAKHILTAEGLVRNLLDAHLSSQEETIFGDFLEGLAIFVCNKVYGGKKSSAQGIDLEFEKSSIRYIVTIKSGPNWGNSSQIARMRDEFRRTKRILGTRGHKAVVAVNGCCYGRDSHPQKGDYLKLCGQRFWEFISGNKDLYTDIIEPLGRKARERNDEFQKAYARIVNRFTLEFGKMFCTLRGQIDWKKLVKFNSSVLSS